MKMSVWILVVVFFSSAYSFAYVPPYWMIMSKTADNHGKGPYVVDQNVLFGHADDAQIINERWIVLDENNMRLEARGRKGLQDRFALTVVYKNGRSYFIDENGVRQSMSTNDDFFEPFFHFRYSKNIKPTLVKLNIAPSVSLKSVVTKFNPLATERETEPYVRLSRVGGVITYGIGTPTPASSTESYPGVWIEQDQFVIRRIRFPSALQVDANEYKNYSGGLWLPRERELSWNESHSAKIILNNASTAKLSPQLKASLEPASLDFGKDSNLSRRLPEDQVIRDFYSRMR